MGFLFSLMAKLGLDKSEYDSGIDGAKKSASTFAQVLGANLATKGIGLVTKGLTNASKKMIGFAKDSVSTGMEFDAAMAQVAATMGKTVGEIQDLQEYAQKMGATTKFTATEAANALNYMALAGYDADMSMKMLPNVLNLAAAGNMDLAAASDMVTDSQSALGLSTEETTKLVDKMAKASSKSNTSVAQLGDAILTVGGTAKNIKGGTTALATALGILADNGIKGAEGGTALRNIVNTLAAPTGNAAKRFEALGVKVFDSTGSMRGLNEVFGDLSESMSTLTQEQRMEALSDIFNVRDLKSAEALLANYGKRWDELSGSIDDAQGAAQKMAETQLDNLQGDITLMKSAVDGAKQSLSKGLTPALRDVVQRITRYVSSSKAKKFLKEVGAKLGDIVKFIVHKVGVALPRLGRLFTEGGNKVKIFGVAIAGAIVVMKSATSWVGALSSALGLLTGGLAISALTYEKNYKSVAKLNKKEQELVDTVSNHIDAYDELNESRRGRMKAIDDETGKVEDLWMELQTLVDENGNVKDADKERVDFITGELNEALGTEITRNGDVIESYKEIGKEVDKLIRKKRASLYLEAFGDQYKEALTNQSKALEAVSTQRELYDEQLKRRDKAQQEYDAAMSAPMPSAGGSSSALRRRAKERQRRIDNARAELDAANKALSEQGAELYRLKSQAYEDTAIIGAYENASDAFERGEYDASQDFLKRWNQPAPAAELSGGAARQAAAQQADVVKSAERERDAYEQGLKAGRAGFTQEGLEEKNKAIEEATALLREYGNAAGWAAYQVEDGAQREIAATQNAAGRMGEINDASLKDLIEVFRKKEAEVTEYKANYEAGVEGFTKTELDELQKSLEGMRKVLSSKAFEAEESAKKIGENIALGLARGMKTKEYAVNNAARSLGQTAINQLENVPQVASPSKVTTRIGRFIGQGLALGMLKEKDNVESAATALAESALSEPQSALYAGGSNSMGSGRKSSDGRENGILGELVAILKDIRANMGQQLVLDTGVIAGAVDRALGRTAALKARGN